MTDTPPDSARSEPRPEKMLVVGLGASAGGIEALRTFFTNVPEHSGSAYVVILHLSPEHDSKLAEVLQTSALIDVTQVTKPVRIEPDHVYVVPPNRRLTVSDGMLNLSDMTQPEHRRSPVDVFFRALPMPTARVRCASCSQELGRTDPRDSSGSRNTAVW